MNCLVKQFAMCFGVVDIWLLNVMEVFSMCGCWATFLDKQIYNRFFLKKIG